MPRSTASSAAPVDFNKLWPSKDLSKLGAIGKNSKGICGCIPHCHGSRTPVYGSTFRSHMTSIHPPRYASEPPRSSIPQGAAGPSTARLQSVPLETTWEEDSFDFAGAGFDSGEEGDVEDVEDEEDGLAAGLSAATLEPEARVGILEDGEAEERDTTTGLLDSIDDFFAHYGTSSDSPTGPAPSPPPEPVTVDTSLTDVKFGHQLRGSVADDDLILSWPFPLPTYLLNPPHAGNQPNPYAEATTTPEALPLSERLAPLLNHALAGTFNVSRRASELVLKVFGTAVRLAERVQYQRDRQWYEANHPVVPGSQVEIELDDLNPGLREDNHPSTSRAALNKLEVYDHVYEHPMCKNSDCHHVFYHIIGKEGLVELPPLCPACSFPCRLMDKPDVLFFGRRTLWSELETVLGVPGVEEAVENRQDRKDRRDREDIALRTAFNVPPYRHILREQDDGTAWNDPRDANLPEHLEGCLQLTVNLGLDWANPTSRRSASSNSMGPISLHLANLPCQARSSVACSMILGITPGPKEPKGPNLHKLLLPLVLELRSAQLNGLWVKTPLHPQGRLVRVKLGCVIADRPAALGILGGGHFSSPATPCIRCTAHQDGLADAVSSPAPLRNWHAHALAQLQQHSAYNRELILDQQAFRQEEAERDARARRPRKPKSYPESRREAVEERTCVLRGHISALALIPGYDAFAWTPFDVMHAMLEGVCKAYFYSVMVRGDHGLAGEDEDGGGSGSASETTRKELAKQAKELIKEVKAGQVRPRTEQEMQGLEKLAEGITGSTASKNRVLGPADLTALQTLLSEVQVPSSIARLHPLFGSASAGTPTADQWRAFASVYAPLVLPRLWQERAKTPASTKRFNPEELRAMMGICEMIIISMRSSISDTQLAALQQHMTEWSTLVFRLHPSIRRKTNFHVILHTLDDITAHGPPYNWWSFLVERINYHAKNVNHAPSSVAPQIATYKALLRARQVESTRMRMLDEYQPISFEEEEAQEELQHAFRTTSVDKASSALEVLSARYQEVETGVLNGLSHHRAGATPIRFTHGEQRFNLDRLLLNSLQACLARGGVPTRLEARLTPDNAALPFLDDGVLLHQTMEWGRTRIDAAEYGQRFQYAPTLERIRQLVRSRNSLVEVVKPNQRYGLQGGTPISGVLCLLFEHSILQVDGTSGPKELYGVLRKFQEHSGDPYQIKSL